MTTTSVKILHVEDDPRQQSVMKALLERHRFQVIPTECGLDALQLIKDDGVEIVLLDYDLPDMSAAQLAREIRKIRPSIPIVLLSGRPFLPPSELAHVDAFLVKGCPVDELLCTIVSVSGEAAIALMWDMLSGDADRWTVAHEPSNKPS